MIFQNEAHKEQSFKSFVSFVIENRNTVIDYKTGKYNCNTCGGSGKVLPSDAKSDPVEGYKLVDRRDCSICDGTGRGTEEQWETIYHNNKNLYLQEKKKVAELEFIRKKHYKSLRQKKSRR
jgi:hypothetical protein